MTVGSWPRRAKAELKLPAVNRSSRAGRQSKFRAGRVSVAVRNQRDFVARNAARLIEGAPNKRWVGSIPGQITSAHPRSAWLAIRIARKKATDGRVKFVLA